MPLTFTKNAVARPGVRRVRSVGPHCRGGASSLLRLAQPVVTRSGGTASKAAAKRLPSVFDLSGWLGFEEGAVLPVTRRGTSELEGQAA
ncbi:hypothetical protein BH11PSE8_BH11PSE8_22970 [soil metagenome]